MNPTTTFILLRYKLFALCTFMSIGQVNGFIMGSPAQEILDKEVSLHLSSASLREVLYSIEKASQVKFVFSSNQISLQEKISLDASSRRLGDVLYELLNPRDISFKVHPSNEFIILSPKDPRPSSPAGKDNASSFRMPVTGIVTDATTAQPMAGVNVVVKGSTNGTSTDAQGTYVLEAEQNDRLVFSFIGYRTQEIPVTQNRIEVALQEELSSLNEVIVNAGYWEVKEKEQTGNISKVTSEEIQKQPVANPLAAMMGRMPGVYIEQTSGVTGGGFNIQIRGQNSLRNTIGDNGNLPLYIIDGVPFTSTPLTSVSTSGSNLSYGNPLSAINPSDILSIEVLKDADATAIYGSRGANGVILITTRKGKEGKTSFDMNIYTGVGKITRKMPLLSTPQYIQLRKEAFRNEGITPPETAYDLVVWDTTRYTDWQKMLIGNTARTTNAQASLSGGNATTQFLMTGGFYKESSVFAGDFGYHKGSAHFSLSHASTNQKFKMQLSASYVIEKNELPSEDLSTTALLLAPNAPALFTNEGALNWENSTWTNPWASTLRRYIGKTNNLIANTTLSYQIIPGLFAKAGIGFTNVSTHEKTLYPIASMDPAYLPTGYALWADNTIQTWIAEPQLDYNKRISEGVLNITVGSTIQENRRESRSLYASGYTSDALLPDIKAATSLKVEENGNTQYRYAAVFSRINYNWKGKYILNMTGRRDGSSRFAPNKQFSNFGALGAAWIFSEENWMNWNVLSFGKIRTSFGVTGSDQIPDYGYVNTFAVAGNYNNSPGLVPNRIPNPEYSWETNKKMEAALELGFFKDRLRLSTSVYRNRSSNQLVGFALAPTAGFTSIQYNLPAVVQNTGLELQLSTVNITHDKVQWTSSLNLTLPRNKLVSYPGIEASSYASVYEVGRSLSVRRRYRGTGVDSATGLYTFEDVNTNGAIAYPEDIVTVNVGQHFYGGVQNTFQYRNLELDILFQFVSQSGFNYAQFFNIPGSQSNQPVYVLSRWQKPGDYTSVQRAGQDNDTYSAYTQNSSSSNTISDASYIRLKNVALSWTLPARWTTRMAVERTRLYVQGQNLLTFTNYKGGDPETQSGNVLPPLRLITAGIQITL